MIIIVLTTTTMYLACFIAYNEVSNPDSDNDICIEVKKGEDKGMYRKFLCQDDPNSEFTRWDRLATLLFGTQT